MMVSDGMSATDDKTPIRQAGNLGVVVTRERFAEASGLTEETIRGMVNRGYLPSVLIGRHRMINVVALTKHLESLDFDA